MSRTSIVFCRIIGGMRRFTIVLSCVLLGCGTSQATPDASVSDATTDTPSDGSLGSSLVTAGFAVTAGTYAFFDTSLCCSLPTCFGNNPSSPYASVSFPGADGGLSPSWQLRQDEAIIVIATTPPHARYFGYTPYVYDESTDAGRALVFGSIADTTNDLVIATSSPGPFSATAVLVMTPNQTTAATVTAALASAGYPSAVVNVIAVPSTSDVVVGLDPSAATFGLLQRMALLDDPDAGAAYQANPPVTALRATPTTELPANGYGAPTFRTPGTGTNESALASSMKALHDAIVAKYSAMTAIALNMGVHTPDQNDQYGFYCIDNGVDCAGDNRDAVYGTSDPFFLAQNDLVVVYGVNHTKTGKTTYSNASIYDLNKLLGVASADDRAFAGSAAVFVPADPNVDSLYAWTFARDCGTNAFCTAIPTTCPGVPLGNLAFIASRAYLEPQTKTRPLSTELVLDDAVHFKP